MYPSVDCVSDYGLTEDREWLCRVWICPPQLFMFQGSCVANCPSPYFNFIKRNATSCAVICDEGATYDNVSRICSCGPLEPRVCPVGSTQTPASCTCSTGFYDGYACVPRTFLSYIECAPGFLGLNGTCLTCPFKCVTCIVNAQAGKSTFLICTVCMPGYSLSSDAVCRATCNGLAGQAPNPNSTNSGTCITCSDPNCEACLVPIICTKCTPLYALNNGICVLNCTTQMAFAGSGAFTCLPPITNCLTAVPNYINGTAYLQCLTCNPGTYIFGNACVSTCPAGTNSDSTTSSCKCATVGYILINQVCTQMVTCPIKMYYNNTIASCLPCPYGCISCIGSPEVCFSCAPGFIHFAYSTPFCGFDSPFYQCIVGYTLDSANRRCFPTDMTSDYNGCYAAVPGCSLCYFQSSSVCVVCQNGTFLHQNACLLGCPLGTWSHQGVCLQNNPYDQFCKQQGIRSNSSFFYTNSSTIANSTNYPFYTQSAFLPDNNPITSILSNNVYDTSTRSTYFREGFYYCEKCQDGYGVASNGTCQPCSTGCATCISTSNYWCVTCQSGYNLTFGRQCIGGNGSSFSCPAGQFLNTNNVCVDASNCTNFYIVEQKRCWYDAPVGTTIIR